jgi:putative ABC transport system permease protein
MWRASLKSLLARRLRLALTLLAVVIGVAFVSGTLVLTDTMQQAFGSFFGGLGRNQDLIVRGALTVSDAGNELGGGRPGVPLNTVERVEGVDGVEGVNPAYDGVAQLLDAQGRPIGGQQVGTFGLSAPAVGQRPGGELREGELPRAEGEAALDLATAELTGTGLGDTIRFAAQGPVQEAEVVGLLEPGYGGTTTTMLSTEVARRLYSRDGGATSLEVYTVDGTDPDAMRQRVQAALGDGYQVITGAQFTEETSADVNAGLTFLTSGLLVFAAVALLVGGLLIYNTFSIILAQRTRELALLRSLGASRRQVLGSVIGEAALVGAVGGLLGLAAGVLVAVTMRALLAAAGTTLPPGGLVVSPRTIVLGLLVGVVVTVLAALAPGRRALRVAPVVALHEVPALPDRRAGRLRVGLGLALLVAGLGALGAAAGGDPGLPAVIGGAVALIIAMALLGGLVAAPLITVLGWPLRRLGPLGQLAQQNASRSPGRTSAAAAALTIGVGLVIFSTVFGASIRASADASIERALRAEFRLQSTGVAVGSLPAGAVDAVAPIDQVAAVVGVPTGLFQHNGTTSTVAGADLPALAQVIDLAVSDEAPATLGPDDVLIAESVADAAGISPGDDFAMRFNVTGERTARVAGTFDSGAFGFDYLIGADRFAEDFPSATPTVAYVKLADGVSAASAREALQAALADYPTVRLLDQTEIRAQLSSQVDTALALTFALLLLSILVALLGIANTLSLSIFERVREFGMLRAVGATRPQVRSIIRWEAVLVALLGAVLGCLVGLVYGWAAVLALRGRGVTAFTVPWTDIAITMVVSAFAGVLTAVAPARRAARVDILRAIGGR